MDIYGTALDKSGIGNGHMEQHWTSLGTYGTAMDKSTIGNGHQQNSNGQV